MSRLIALAVIILLGFSGCIGSESKSPGSEPPVQTEATVDEASGGIEGFVTNDEVVPIAGAEVALVGRSQVVKSDSVGKFAFSKLEPGDYNLAINRIGYFAKSMKTTVKAGEVTRVDITLQSIPVAEEGFDEVIKFSDKLPASDACAAREAVDAEAAAEWPEPTRGVTWQKYPVVVNASKADGTDLLAIRMRVALRHQPSDVTKDIDIRLVDPAGKTLADGWQDTADEDIDYQKVLPPGAYTVYVCYWAGAQADYKLTVTTSFEQGERAKYLRENPKEIEYPDDEA